MKKNYDILDLLKFFLSIMIVAIHTELFPKFLFPWLRIAVPMFFIISGFLFFNKIKETKTEVEQKQILKKFVIRQLKLYIFWFIITLPVTIYIRKEWFSDGVLFGLYKLIINTLFSSTFIASWFIVATIEGTVVVFYLSKKLNHVLLYFVFGITYIFCCLSSSYIETFDGIKNFMANYNAILPAPQFTFLSAIFWILVGKSITNINKEFLIKCRTFIFILIIIFCLSLKIEWNFVSEQTGLYNNDCYISLIPLVPLIFLFVFSFTINLKKPKLIRNISTIIYPFHATVAQIIKTGVKIFISNYYLMGLFTFIITLIISICVALIILKLKDKKYFKVLKYSY